MWKKFKSWIAMLLVAVMVINSAPISAIMAHAESTTEYLFFATDRHANTTVIGNIINNMESAIGENELDYLGLGGDMVGSGSSHPSYNSSTVLAEVTGATSSLSATNVDIVAGIHDMNVTDDKDIVLPYSGGGAKIYEGNNFYVYGVPESCISGEVDGVDPETEANAFVTWANGSNIDQSKVIIVLSHYPLHANRGDNTGAGYWHNALNTIATGSVTGTEVTRNVVFFHGHNQSDLDYGKYTVKLTAGYNSSFDNTGDGEYTLYLDAVRIYDPCGSDNETANNAYVADGEAYPEYTELRDKVITKETFDSLDSDSVSGIVFIDGATTDPDGTVDIADYTEYGPNNELYLAYGQAVAFDLNATATNGKVASVQLAIKTVGGEGSVEVYGVDSDGNKTACLNETISTATDMYYDITALNGKTVVIRNSGDSDEGDDAIISLTNIKVTYTEAQTTDSEEETDDTAAVASYSLLSVSRSTATVAIASLSADEVIEDTESDNTTEEDDTTEDDSTEDTEEDDSTESEEETKPNHGNNSSGKPNNGNNNSSGKPNNNQGNNKNHGKNNR